VLKMDGKCVWILGGGVSSNSGNNLKRNIFGILEGWKIDTQKIKDELREW